MSPFTDPPAVVGHRGAPTLAPQNTPASFLAAAEEGASWVELDVRRSADDVLVCQHDPVDAEGRPLVEQTAADLAAAGVWTLASVLDALPAGLGVDVEVKNLPGEPDYDPDDAVAAAVAAELAAREGERPWMTSAFNPATVAVLAEHAPQVPAGLLHLAMFGLEAALPYALEQGASVLCPQRGAPGLDAATIARVHEAGLAVFVWTVDDAAEARALAGEGVDAICTNHPGAIAAALDEDDPQADAVG